MTTITWLIEAMNCKAQQDNLTDVVVSAHWRCNGTDGTYAGTVHGTSSFTQPGDPFIAYADLTEAQVLEWCYAAGLEKDFAEATVKAQIANQVSPPIITPPLPWVTPATI